MKYNPNYEYESMYIVLIPRFMFDGLHTLYYGGAELKNFEFGLWKEPNFFHHNATC